MLHNRAYSLFVDSSNQPSKYIKFCRLLRIAERIMPTERKEKLKVERFALKGQFLPAYRVLKGVSSLG